MITITIFIFADLTALSQRASDPADCIVTAPTCSTDSACRAAAACSLLTSSPPDSSLSPSPCLQTVISTITKTDSLSPLAPQLESPEPEVSCHQQGQQCHHCSPSPCSPGPPPTPAPWWPACTATWTASTAIINIFQLSILTTSVTPGIITNFNVFLLSWFQSFYSVLNLLEISTLNLLKLSISPTECHWTREKG